MHRVFVQRKYYSYPMEDLQKNAYSSFKPRLKVGKLLISILPLSGFFDSLVCVTSSWFASFSDLQPLFLLCMQKTTCYQYTLVSYLPCLAMMLNVFSIVV